MMAHRSSKPNAKSAPVHGSDAAARRKSSAFRVREQHRARRRRAMQWAAAVLAVLAVGVVVIVIARSGSSRTSKPPNATASNSAAAARTLTGPSGPEGIVLEQGTPLADASASGQTVDGIECNSMEQAVYHIHIHLSIYIDGAMRPVPAGIGVVEPVAQQTANGTFDQASRCYYWLHTHAQDGIVHVEAPNEAVYTLGQFFDIWHQPLTPSQIGSQHGTVTAYVDGKPHPGNPAAIRLTSHEDIQLDLGTPTIAPRRIDWSHAQL